MREAAALAHPTTKAPFDRGAPTAPADGDDGISRATGQRRPGYVDGARVLRVVGPLPTPAS